MPERPRIPGESPVVSVSDRRLRGHFGYQLKRAFNVIQSDLARTLKPFELRMLTYTALVLVAENPGLRQSQLADAMEIERPNLVAIIEELERRLLVERHRVPNDRRAYALEVTPAGRTLVHRATAAVETHEAAFLQGLEPETRAAATEALKHIEKGRRRG